MAFPAGVTTATISLGTMFDFRGIAVEDVTAKVEVFLGGNATKLNYRGTGQTVVPSVFTVKAVEGMVSFQLPHVDQPGFFAGDGSEAKYWAYIISIQATPPGSKAVSWVKRIQPVVGQTSIDLDNVVDGELTSFVSTPQATVTSVNGMTGDVWVSGGGSGGSIDLSAYATKDELDAAIQGVDTSLDTTEIYSRINEVEASVPDVSALVTRNELQNYALAEDIPDTSHLATKDELQNYAPSGHAHTDLEQRITALEETPSGGTVTLVESPEGSGLYEIRGV